MCGQMETQALPPNHMGTCPDPRHIPYPHDDWFRPKHVRTCLLGDAPPPSKLTCLNLLNLESERMTLNWKSFLWNLNSTTYFSFLLSGYIALYPDIYILGRRTKTMGGNNRSNFVERYCYQHCHCTCDTVGTNFFKPLVVDLCGLFLLHQ